MKALFFRAHRLCLGVLPGRMVARSWRLALFMVFLAAGIAAQAAMYLKIEGIDGEATAAGHEDWIELESFQWGVSRAISAPTGGTRETGPAIATELTLTKKLDKASPILFVEAAAGRAHDRVTLEITTEGEIERTVYYELVLDDVLVSSYSVSSAGERPLESVTLNFTRIEVRYTPIRPDGTPDAAITRIFDFARQRE